MTLNLVTAPTLEPLTLAVAKAHLRVTDDNEDELIELYVAAARERVEGFTRRQLAGAVWEVKLDRFPRGPSIELPRPPLRSVTHVKYLDVDGTEQTMSSSLYRVHTFAGPKCMPGGVALEEGEDWPDTQPVQGAVTIRFEAGYAAAAETDQDVVAAATPAACRQAMLLTLGELFARREDAIAGTTIGEVPLSARSILWDYHVA